MYIALDTRLGCLDANLAPDSEPQKMIDCTQILFDSLYKLETRFPVWKYVSSPTWRKFVKAGDVCVECVWHKFIWYSARRENDSELFWIVDCWNCQYVSDIYIYKDRERERERKRERRDKDKSVLKLSCIYVTWNMVTGVDGRIILRWIFRK